MDLLEGLGYFLEDEAIYTYEKCKMIQNEYIKGIKKIKHITYNQRPEIKKEPSINVNQMSDAYECYFNNKGNLVLYINLLSNYKYIYTYDTMGRLNRIFEIDKYTNQLTIQNKIKYNEGKNFKEKISIYKESGIERKSFIHSFDENEYTLQLNLNQKNEDSFFHSIFYPENSVLVEEYVFDSEIVLSQIKEYNSSDQIFFYYQFDREDNTRHFGDAYTYYENGLIETVISEGKYGLNQYYKYKFDKKGNWIKKTHFNSKDDMPKIIIERELEFY